MANRDTNGCSMLAVLAFMLTSLSGVQGNVDPARTKFVFTFPYNPIVGTPRLFITTEMKYPVMVSVSVPGDVFSHSTYVNHIDGATIDLPDKAAIEASSSIKESNKAIIVNASDDVSVHGYYHPDGSVGTLSTDGFFVLPTTSLDKDYVAVAYESSSGIGPFYSQFVVTAVEDNTTVNIKGQIELSMNLQQYESYQFVPNRAGFKDITGMSIKADKPISVMSGHQCTFVPVNVGNCDYLMEHLPPTSILGHQYLLAPFLGRTSGFVYRIVSASPGTTNVALSGESISLQGGEFYEGDIVTSDEVLSIMADKPVMVAQYAKGSRSDNVGDPFMIVIPTTQKFSKNVTFPRGTLSGGGQQHYISIISTECDNLNSFNLDGLSMSNQISNILQTSDGDFCVLRTEISPGFHSVTHPTKPFLVLVYGFGNVHAYGFVASFNPTSSCPRVKTIDPYTLTWPQTEFDQTAYSIETCPPYFEAVGPRGTRKCICDLESDPQWQNVALNDCIGDEDINELLVKVSQSVVTLDNVTEIGYDVAQITSRSSEINATGLEAVAIILESIVDVESPSPKVVTSVIETIDNILNIDEKVFEATVDQNAPTRILLSLEEQVSIFQRQGPNITVSRTNIEVVAVQLLLVNIQDGLAFASVLGSSDLFSDPEDVPVDESDASIVLPAAVASRFRSEVNDSALLPASFALYQNSKLFQSRRLKNESTPESVRSVGTRVISATIEGLEIDDLLPDQPVVSTYVHEQPENGNNIFDNFQCVFWDFELENGQGDWSNEGCRLVETTETDRSICHCDHLTSFAVLIDFHGQRYSNQTLGIISMIGCCISIVALLITLFTYLASKSLRTKTPRKILICLCFTLLCLYIVFVAGVYRTQSYAGCIVVAVLLHYLTLSSVSWMGVEAVNLYLLFVKVLNADVSHFMRKACFAAWGVPVIPVIIVLAIDASKYVSENHCFFQPSFVFYFADLLILFIILIFNFAMFVLIIYKLTCGRKNIGRSSDRDQKQSISRAVNAVAISAILGLTWVFGFLTIIDNRGSNLAFQVLFCIFNSMQGVLIFLLFCVRSKEIRDVWKSWFCCAVFGKWATTGTRSAGHFKAVSSNNPKSMELDKVA